MNVKIVGKITQDNEEIYVTVEGEQAQYLPGPADQYVKIRKILTKKEETN